MISNKCYYALRAVLELARKESEKRVPIADIAKAQEIPPRFLEAILRQLKQAGITDSVRGKDGGYHLARPAKDIYVGEIIRLFEGPLVAVRQKANVDIDILDTVWDEAEKVLSTVYDSTDFATLVSREDDLRDDRPIFYSI